MAAVTGERQLRRTLARLARTAPQAVLMGIYEEGATIFERSQELVPVDTGRLMQSGVLAVQESVFERAVHVGYGTNYGLPVHERTELDEGRQARGSDRRSKYLEIPFLEQMPGFAARVAKRTEERLMRGAALAEMPDRRGKARERDERGRFK